MNDSNKPANVRETAQQAIRQNKPKNQGRQFALWFGALILGGVLGWMGIQPLNELFNFVATVFTRLFQFIAIPTITLAVITTLAELGATGIRAASLAMPSSTPCSPPSAPLPSAWASIW